jgi:tetratricopeptide (TPR) repeat protein
MATSSSPFDRGLAAMEHDRLDEAIALFTAAADSGDRPALALSKRGVCRVRAGDRAGAARDFASALDRDPKCVPALVNLGNLALEANMLEEALSRYNAAIQLDERSAAAHHNLGVVYRRMGRLMESVRELRRAAMLENQPKKILERWWTVWRRK